MTTPVKTSESTVTETQTVQAPEELVLRLQSGPVPSTDDSHHVRWASSTVDNEGMGKKKSKCCCIYKKPKNWEDSSSDDSDCETGHCRGHVEKKKKNAGCSDGCKH